MSGSAICKILVAFTSVSWAGISSAQAALVIRNTPTSNVSCSAGVCTATAGYAVMNASDLTSMLASSDVTLVTGSMAKDMKVLSAFSWTSAHRLTLDAYRSIVVEKTVTVAGPGALTLTTNDGGSGGTFATQFPARVDCWDLSSSLIINGASYVLAGDLATLSADVAANASGHYALAKNYDAGNDGTYAGSPIPAQFTGAFEGLGHIIEHLTIHANKTHLGLGLFSSLYGAQVENIGMTGVYIRAFSRSEVGMLAGTNSGSITNAFAKGVVRGAGYSEIGGLVGGDVGTVVSSYTTGKVMGGPLTQLGGLIGRANGSIRSSHSTANVIGTQDTRAGGLVGILGGSLGGSLTDSWAAGDVANGDDDSSGQDFPGAGAGGLVGNYFDDSSANVDLENSYATGNVTGGKGVNAGGLIGLLYTDYQGAPVPIIGSYSTGRPTASAGTWQNFVGGFVGVAYDTFDQPARFSDAYWDTDTSGITDPSQGAGDKPNEPGITALTTAQFQSGLPAGFAPAIWAENPSINGGLPYLIANPPR